MIRKIGDGNEREHAWDVWFSGWHWRERIINFTPSWFTVTMGTGIMVQLLAQFPYPAQWLRNLAYCFWVLDIVLFSVFLCWFILRYSWYPALIMRTLEDFSESNYLGAIPIAWDTIITGLTIFYADHDGAMWVGFGLFWIAVVLTLAVSLLAVFVMFARQPEHDLSVVTGVWLLSFIPMIVTSATGAALANSLPYPSNMTVLTISFLLWSAGTALCFMCTAIYLWRLMSRNLPAREAIISSCIPLGPLGQGAFSIQTQANVLSSFLRLPASDPTLRFRPSSTSGSTTTELPVLSTEGSNAVAEMINWLGLIMALMMIGLCSFWLAEAIFSIYHRVPKKFSIGFWGLVFPLGTYANAVVLAGKDLRNDGLKGWGAACSVLVMLFWCFCAAGTVYKGFWRGELFYAPGLEGWEPRDDGRVRKREARAVWEGRRNQVFESPGLCDFAPSARIVGSGGSYTYKRRVPRDEEARRIQSSPNTD